MKQKWPTLEGRLNHPLTSTCEAVKQMKNNGDNLTREAKKHLIKPYCPWNGCGMVNGAAPLCIFECLNCGHKWELTTKLCPKCHHCFMCGRIGKRFYEK